MNITPLVMALVMIPLGVFTVIRQSKKFRNGEKDPLGLKGGFLITGIGLVVLGIICIIKAFVR
jgi:hypothetical protein